MKEVYETLQDLNIDYEVHEHPAVFTVEEARQHRIDVDFGENKNLFLRNKKGSKYYLVTLEGSKRLDLNKLAEKLGENKLGFASEERLQEYLGLTPGAVSPFGLINDLKSEVTFVLDKDLLKNNKLGFHPNINTQTIVLDTKDFQDFLDSRENKVIITEL